VIAPLIKLRRRKVIVDVDTQMHFFRNDSFSCIQNHHCILSNIQQIMKWSQANNVPTISTIQIHSKTADFCDFDFTDAQWQKKISCTLRNRRRLFDACDCTDLPVGILERYEQVVFSKRCFDPFLEPRIERLFSELSGYEFILIGVLAEEAVKATAMGLLGRLKRVTIVADAVGFYNEITARKMMRCVWAKGARFVNTKRILTYPVYNR